MMLASGARPSVQRLGGNKSICIAPKPAMKPTRLSMQRRFQPCRRRPNWNRRRCNAVLKRPLAPVSSAEWSWGGPSCFLMHCREASCLDVHLAAWLHGRS